MKLIKKELLFLTCFVFVFSIMKCSNEKAAEFWVPLGGEPHFCDEFVFVDSDSEGENQASAAKPSCDMEKMRDFQELVVRPSDITPCPGQNKLLWKAFEDRNIKNFSRILQIYNNPNAFNPRAYGELKFDSRKGLYRFLRYDLPSPSLTIMHAIASCPKAIECKETLAFYVTILKMLKKYNANFNIPVKKHYINLNVPCENERTPLHFACQQGSLDIVAELLIGHADLKSKDCQEITPVHLAAEHGHGQLLGLFFEYYEKPGELMLLKTDISDNFRTPVHFAARAGKKEALLKILNCEKKYFVPNPALIKDSLGYTPLHDAVRSCQDPYDVTAILLQHFADVNAQDNLGQTPLHALVQQPWSKNRCDTARLMLAAGASRVVQNHNNQTPEIYLRSKYLRFRKFLWKRFFNAFDKEAIKILDREV